MHSLSGQGLYAGDCEARAVNDLTPRLVGLIEHLAQRARGIPASREGRQIGRRRMADTAFGAVALPALGILCALVILLSLRRESRYTGALADRYKTGDPHSGEMK